MKIIIRNLAVISFVLITAVNAASDNRSGLTKEDIAAEKIWDYLHRFLFDDNDIIATPDIVEKNHTLDCDDYALYAYVKFKAEHIPAKVVIIANPVNDSVKYKTVNHAVCIFRSGDYWRIMDYDSIRVCREKDWRKLPARLYGKRVMYIEVDAGKSWLQGEPYYPMRNDKNWSWSE